MTRLSEIIPRDTHGQSMAGGITGLLEDSSDYRYRHVTMGVLLDDFRFGKSALKAGDPFPDFDIPTTDGGRIRRSDFIGRKPLLLVFGSVTCPMTVSSIPPLKQLHAEFGDRVGFVMLGVREAHPAETYEQPQTLEQKRRHAVELQKRYDIPWTVGIDDIDGTLHRALDTKPNAAFLMDTDGRIAFRSLWASDSRALGDALKSVAAGQRPGKTQSAAMLAPMARGIGHFHEVLTQAGPRAGREMLFAAPPIAVMGRIAGLFRRLAPHKRGAAAILTVAALLSTAAAAISVFG